MIKAAEAKGLSADSVDSVYLKGEEAILEHERRNGYDKAYSPHGVQENSASGLTTVFPKTKQVLV
jgi:hypothetical protein